jgi:UDP-N-acetylglucosamine pyrophosphorylase
MEQAHVAESSIRSFLAAAHRVRQGERGWLPESSLHPVDSLPHLDPLPKADADASPDLSRLAVIKLNGGLGTSMGLDRAKSLLPIRENQSFLDFIARQILHLRGSRSTPAFYLMNSFSTQADSLAALHRHPHLATEGEPLDFLQSKVPKLDAESLLPASWPPDPDLEWCPPGHGDLYPAVVGTGLLQRLRTRGIDLLFVSNADNLGATVDLRILHYFARSELSFLMEVAHRTPADRKGGHVARRRDSGRLLLRESAQVPKEDETAFQNIDRHRFFNTNNLWIRLDHLEAAWHANGGAFPLPLITNAKSVDPKRASSPRVLQLESAMGAAIECFENAGALIVGRQRFAPVKTTADLLALRSDAYIVTSDHRLELDPQRAGQPPHITLDPEHYRVLADFEAAFAQGIPSLVACETLTVSGPVHFTAGVICQGRVSFTNTTGQPVLIAPGTYSNTQRHWPETGGA